MASFEEALSERSRKREKEITIWKGSCPSVEELLCLQLLGYSSLQIVERINPEINERLKRMAAKATRELDKAKRILDRQAKAGVITIPYYADDYPYHFRNHAAVLLHTRRLSAVPPAEDKP